MACSETSLTRCVLNQIWAHIVPHTHSRALHSCLWTKLTSNILRPTRVCQVSWTLGFAIPGAAMALAIGLFWAGRGGYRHVTPTESPMARVVRVVAAATRNRCVCVCARSWVCVACGVAAAGGPLHVGAARVRDAWTEQRVHSVASAVVGERSGTAAGPSKLSPICRRGPCSTEHKLMLEGSTARDR